MAVMGILGAIKQEVDGIIAQLVNVNTHIIGQRTYYQGTLHGKDVVVVYSRIGKVAAAATVTTLILQFNVQSVVFVGVAGGIHDDVNIGDVVIARDLIQYDMDVSPLRPKYEIPLLNKTYFDTDAQWVVSIQEKLNKRFSKEQMAQAFNAETLAKFGIDTPTIHVGTIGSADQFVGTQAQKQAIQATLPNMLCVEMEGAAVAQVCYEFGVPFMVIRTISDKANHVAGFSFEAFIEEISLVYGEQIMTSLLSS